MKDNETRQQFIVLRTLGKSYETIARELNVSKPVLLKWGKEYEEEIANRKAIELEALREKYRLTTQARVAPAGLVITEARIAPTNPSGTYPRTTLVLSMATTVWSSGN